MRTSRGLGIWQGTALYVGAVLGTGILYLPALAVHIAGPASIVAWAGLVVLSIPLAILFAVLGSRYPDAGGVSNFANRAFGSFIGGTTGWWFYGGVMMGAPSAAIMGGFYISDLFHASYHIAIIGAFVMLCIAITVNAIGFQTSSWLQVILTGILAVLLIIAVLTSLPSWNLKNFIPFAPHGWFVVGDSAGVLMFSFVGWEAVAPLSSEFRNPRRSIPRATGWALCIVAILYLSVAFATISVMGDGAGNSDVPIENLMVRGIGNPGHIVTAIIAAVLTIGTTNAYVGGAAKIGSALARDGALPSRLSKGSQSGEVPRRSLFVVSVCALAVLVITSFSPQGLTVILHASSACFVAVYVSGTVAGFVLLRSSVVWRAIAGASALLVTALLIFSGYYLIIPVILTLVSWGFLKTNRSNHKNTFDA